MIRNILFLKESPGHFMDSEKIFLDIPFEWNLANLSIDELLNKFEVDIDFPIVGYLDDHTQGIHEFEFGFDSKGDCFVEVGYVKNYRNIFSISSFASTHDLEFYPQKTSTFVIYPALGRGGNPGVYLISNVLAAVGAIDLVVAIGLSIVGKQGNVFDAIELYKYRRDSKKWVERRLDHPSNLWNLLHARNNWTNDELRRVLSRKLSNSDLVEFMRAFGFKWREAREVWTPKKRKSLERDWKKLEIAMSDFDINDYP